MCKQHTIYFGCGHHIQQRMSTCCFRKVIPAPQGGHSWRACISTSYIHRAISGDCKKCYYAAKKLEIEIMAEDLRLGTVDDPNDLAGPATGDLEAIDEWEEASIVQLFASLPHSEPMHRNRYTNIATWSGRRRSKRSTSLLSCEVKPEDVVGHFEWENIIEGSSYTNSPSTDIWDDDADDTGWAQPGEETMACEGSESSAEDQEEGNEDDEDATIGEVDNDGFRTTKEDQGITIGSEDSYITNVWSMSGASWGYISIL